MPVVQLWCHPAMLLQKPLFPNDVMSYTRLLSSGTKDKPGGNDSTDETVCWDLVVTIDLGYGLFSGVDKKVYMGIFFVSPESGRNMRTQCSSLNPCATSISTLEATGMALAIRYMETFTQLQTPASGLPQPRWYLYIFWDDLIVVKLKTKMLLIVWMPGWK